MSKFYRTETIRIEVEVRNENLSYINVTSASIWIQDPSGDNVINGSAMTNTSTGIYQFDFNTSSDSPLGVWKLEVKTTSGSKYNIERGSFKLEDSLSV